MQGVLYMSLTMLCPRVSLTILRPAHVSLPARSLPHCCRVTSVDPTHPPASTPRGRYPKTRTAALRMVQYYTNLVQRAGGHATVSVKKWPYTNDLARAARLVLADPRAAAAGLVAEPWMTDPVQSLFRERWRDFLEKAGLTKIKVWLHGIDTLGQLGHLDASEMVTVPIGKITAARLQEIGRQRGVAVPGEKLGAKEVKARLAAQGVTTGTARLTDIDVREMRKLPSPRRAVYRMLDGVYLKRGRDFRRAFSYPEYVTMPDNVQLPLLIVWDRPHGLKNARMASAHAVQRSKKAAPPPTAAAAPAAAAPAPAPAAPPAPTAPAVPAPPAAAAPAAPAGPQGGEEAADEVDVFGDDQVVTGDLDDADDEAGAVAGTLAHAVGMAAEAVRAVPGQTFIRDDVMNPSRDPQHVPTAKQLFSHTTAAEMLRLGHHRAAAWVELLAEDYAATDQRGFSPAERWASWERMDTFLTSLHPSLSWDPEGTWASPFTASIDGYSRVLIESYMVSNDSSRLIDIMVGHRGCRFVYDRRKGSDLCECLFSRCVAVMGQDKVSKRMWTRMFAKIVRQARVPTSNRACRTHARTRTRTHAPGTLSSLCLPVHLKPTRPIDAGGTAAHGSSGARLAHVHAAEQRVREQDLRPRLPLLLLRRMPPWPPQPRLPGHQWHQPTHQVGGQAAGACEHARGAEHAQYLPFKGLPRRQRAG
jgi:hypothetical protein